MNSVKRRKLKRSANLRLLFFTFSGAFILFFLAFAWLLPALTPQVEIPALTEDHVFNSITSHDFRGRIDPRLRNIELQEEVTVKETREIKKEEHSSTGQKPAGKAPTDKKIPAGNYSTEGIPLPGDGAYSPVRQKPVIKAPPRPGPLALGNKITLAPPAPIFKARVIVGEFNSPREAGITSEILVSLNYKPFMRKRNGKYVLQIASFSDTDKAKELLNELKDRNFDAKIIYE